MGQSVKSRFKSARKARRREKKNFFFHTFPYSPQITSWAGKGRNMHAAKKSKKKAS